MVTRRTTGSRRRAAAHACPDCRRPWALRGRRSASGAWIISCDSCGWVDVRVGRPAAERGTDPAVLDDRLDGPLCGWSHGVHVHRGEDDLLSSVETYLVRGWSAGGVGLVVGTPEHRSALRDRLAARGLTSSLGEGRYIELDAARTLEQFMRDGAPDPTRFHDTVGSLVREHAAGVRLHAFGEMVDVLWGQGNHVGALELEGLWTGLQRRISFSLLCGYAGAHVDERSRGILETVHDHVAA